MRIEYRKGRLPRDPTLRRITARARAILSSAKQITHHDPGAPPFERSALAAKLAANLAEAETAASNLEAQRRPWVDHGKISATNTAALSRERDYFKRSREDE